jgi:hypothetical protein
MSLNLSPVGSPGSQFFTDQGVVLSGGLIYVYLAGTTTPVTTYTTSAGTTPNPNPIVLNSQGRPPQEIWLTGGQQYKFVITTAQGVQLTPGVFDNVSGINDVTSGGSPTISEWQPSNYTPSYVSATSFTTVGNSTAVFTPGRRIQTTNTSGLIYATVLSSTYGGSNTTVVCEPDSGVLDSGLITANVSILNAAYPSSPSQLPSAGQLTFVSSTQVKYVPYNGAFITINGVSCRIPSAGVTLTSPAMTANTDYYVYASMVSGVMTLSVSTTGVTIDGITGMLTMIGDSTKTLIGLVTSGSSANTFASAQTWWNNGAINNVSGGATGITFTQGTGGKLSTTTMAGTLLAGNGGSGAAGTLTGYLYGNGASPYTASTTIPSTAITGLPTAGTITNLTTGTQIVNGTSTTYALPNPSYVGWQTLPGNLLMQWGTGSSINASVNTYTETFNTPFTTACFHVNVIGNTNNAGGNANNLVTGMTTSNFTCVWNNNQAGWIYWMAIGK